MQISRIALIGLLFFSLTQAYFLQGQNGQANSTTSDDQSRPKVSVIVFLGVDCPISQKYMIVLKNINDQFASAQFEMTGLIPGKVSSDELNSFLKTYPVTFPVYKDKHNRCTTKLKAEVTPEVFLFDSKGKLKYRGAIDDWYYELGRYRQAANENYLRDAIEAVISGVEPTVTKTKAIGCIIQQTNKNKSQNR